MSLILRTDADQGDAECQPSVLLASLATYGYTNGGFLGHKNERTTDDPMACRFITAGRQRHPPDSTPEAAASLLRRADQELSDH